MVEVDVDFIYNNKHPRSSIPLYVSFFPLIIFYAILLLTIIELQLPPKRDWNFLNFIFTPRVYCDGHCDGGFGRHGATFLATRDTVVQGPADVGHAEEGTGDAVPDGLNPGDGPPSLQECLCPVPPAQLGPLHGPWLLAERTPVGDKAVPGGTQALAGEATDRTITAGHTLCGSTESRPKANNAGSETKRLDLGGNVEAHRRESLHAPGPAVREGGQETAEEIYHGEFGAGPTEEGGGGGGGGGGSDEGGTTSYPRGVVPPSGVV